MRKRIKSYPYYKIIFKVNHQVVLSFRTGKSLRLLNKIRTGAKKFKVFKAMLGFYYAPNYHNEGIYTNLKDLEYSYNLFRELVSEFDKVEIKE